jgi:hypothetical protein
MLRGVKPDLRENRFELGEPPPLRDFGASEPD